ncbi:MAG: exonuclease domain-containing protein [Chloroflexota bacterium]|nr:exonuclease domain-containing protein [Chloroflexota bacterium]
MRTFCAIDFETANPKRVTACSLGCVKIIDGNIVETSHYLIKPVGGHAPFQSKIHGIKDEHTYNRPHFGELYADIEHIFDLPLVAHSMFDKQVLQALSDRFNIDLSFSYTDTSTLAEESISDVKDYKLKTLKKPLNKW